MIMKRIVILCLSALATASLSGCSSAPTKEAMVNADYGSDMSSAQCISATEPAIANSLKDPESAKFRHGTCVKDHWNSVPLAGMGVEFGWVQQGEVNGKNAYGGYVGFRPYKALIKNGQAIRWCIEDENRTCFPVGR